MNNRAAAAVVSVFLLVAALFGSPAEPATGAPESPAAVQVDR